MQVPKPKHKRRVPTQKQRNAISKEQYQLALDWFGDSCSICNSKPIELHHIRYRSAGGRGGYRNLIPLCKHHHDKAHKDAGFSQSLHQERVEAFGEYFYMDAHDLCYHGLIDEPSEEKFNQFMNEVQI